MNPIDPTEARLEALETIRKDNQGNDANTQAKRLLIALKVLGSITTLEARKGLDILAPAARIFDLRYRDGQRIALTWERTFTDAGVKHRIGRYTLMPQAANDDKSEAA